MDGTVAWTGGSTASTFIVAETLRLLKQDGGLDPDVGVHAVPTVQEEIGLRGARTASYAIPRATRSSTCC